MAKTRVAGIIPARYASTRFPAKPLALIAGKTLLQRTYESACLCKELDALYIATDDERILSHAKTFASDVIMTSPHCSNGTERMIDAITNNISLSTYDIFVNIQGDEPCIPSKTIQRVVDALVLHPDDIMSTAVIRITDENDLFNSACVKCATSQTGHALYFSRSCIPGSKNLQEIHINSAKTPYFRHIGIYAYRKDFLLKYGTLTNTPLQMQEDLEQLKVLEHGYKIRVVEVEETAIGVDYPEDIAKVEQWLCTQNSSL